MLRARVATLAVLLLAGNAGCDSSLDVDPGDDPPGAGVAPADEQAPWIVHPTEGTAELERENTSCDMEHPTVPVPDRRLYAIWQRFPLRLAEHGIDGTLRVL